MHAANTYPMIPQYNIPCTLDVDFTSCLWIQELLSLTFRQTAPCKVSKNSFLLTRH